MSRNAVDSRSRDRGFGNVNLPLLLVSGGFVVAFCVFGAIDFALLTRTVDSAFAWSIRLFGFYWQILVVAVFVIGLLIAVLPGAGIPLGGLEKPEFSTFKWAAMIFCTLLASGGVFWAAGEPVSHFVSPPPYFGDDPKTVEAAYSSLAQTFMHWGFLPWALYGSLTVVMFMVYHYGMNLPLAPRTLLYPLFGKQAIEGPIGLAADASVVIAVIAGVCAPIGFLSLQLGYGLNDLIGTPDNFTIHAVVIVVLFAIFTASTVTGVDKGVQFLSRVNVVFGVFLLVFIILVGPSQFVLEGYVVGMMRYVGNLPELAFYRESGGLFADPGWEGSWTMFFWAWYLGWAPLTAIFITRISRGRTVREIVVMLSLIAPLATTFWFSVLGGTGLALDLADPGAVTGPFEGADLPAALLAITKALPYGLTISVLFLALSTVFVITTGDSTTYMVSAAVSGSDNPSTAVRIFWGVALSATALVLVYDGPAAVGNLQSLVVVTAVPVSFVLIPSLWDAPRLVLALDKERKALSR